MRCNYIQSIQNNRNTYSRAFRRLADYILQNNEKIAFVSIQELSNLAEVSTATIHRFCVSLGYDGYTEFQKDVQDAIRTSYKQEVVSAYKNGDSLLVKQIDANIQVLQEMYSAELHDAFSSAVDHLDTARNIYIIGLQADFAMSFCLYYGLRETMDNVHLLTLGIGDMMDQLKKVDERDVLVVIGFRIYNEHIQSLYQHFSQRHARIVVVTDKKSPFCVWADVALVPANKTPSYGQVMCITLIWALVYAVRQKQLKSETDVADNSDINY